MDSVEGRNVWQIDSILPLLGKLLFEADFDILKETSQIMLNLKSLILVNLYKELIYVIYLQNRAKAIVIIIAKDAYHFLSQTA